MTSICRDKMSMLGPNSKMLIAGAGPSGLAFARMLWKERIDS
jgi:cation diffusion facilitator CzcD-associated flavoprotein CzcO